MLVPSSRNEIVDALATLIMVHTSHPSLSQLETIAKKLVNVYPNAADKVPGGSNYVSFYNYYVFQISVFFIQASWKTKLQNKFKNLNRKTNIIQPSKKRKIIENDLTPTCTSSQLDEYNRHKAKMKNIYDSNKWVFSSICTMLSETYGKFSCELINTTINRNKTKVDN